MRRPKARFRLRARRPSQAQCRKRLGLKPGDTLRYEVAADGTVQLRKARKIDLEWARAIEATLTEWHGDGDDDL